ncbi:xanthine dehydrogenase YagS FAD-binding subunit [Kushneria sinocarnis]|uniref:Xanthine dehydrogenase YagS FAD-binding subunit n=1 Tax=Kushneria sinocarnis TaxID=595502 RepID=A0A420WU40_9GAMM|nr:xanthine dehydrogenase family protein subunit M [Kushneria sinocarnis]RKQ96963.1 xanthine dehydrogenase YagS FAD-binding subunit [Kushneria sinocarnis]
MRGFEFEQADDVQQAINRHGSSDALIAGGTTLLDLVKLDVMQPEKVVDVSRLPLKRIETLEDGRLKVGALVSNTELAKHEIVMRDYPVLSEALLSGASTGLRNMASTGGNVMQRTRCPYFRDPAMPCNKREPGTGCSAIEGINRNHAVLGTSEHCIATHPSDMCVGMVAAGATVVVEGSQGVREIPFEEYHLLPGETPEQEHDLLAGELITHVILDPPRGGGQSYLKLRDRASYEFALASCAAIVNLEGDRISEARVAMGGVATKPWRATAAEEALKGQPATRETFERAAEAVMQDAVAYSHNGYKITLGKQAIVRALRDATAAARA